MYIVKFVSIEPVEGRVSGSQSLKSMKTTFFFKRAYPFCKFLQNTYAIIIFSNVYQLHGMQGAFKRARVRADSQTGVRKTNRMDKQISVILENVKKFSNDKKFFKY